MSASATTATFTFRTQANTTVTSTLYVPAGAPPVRLGVTTTSAAAGMLDANTSEATTLLIALPWAGGHLALGRRQ